MTPPRWAGAHPALPCATQPCHVPPRGASSPASVPSSSPMWARSFGAILSFSRKETSKISNNCPVPPLPWDTPSGVSTHLLASSPPSRIAPRYGSLTPEHGGGILTPLNQWAEPSCLPKVRSLPSRPRRGCLVDIFPAPGPRRAALRFTHQLLCLISIFLLKLLWLNAPV